MNILYYDLYGQETQDISSLEVEYDTKLAIGYIFKLKKQLDELHPIAREIAIKLLSES